LRCVVLVPAKPTVALRPASDDDWATIHAWLRRAEIQRWWGSLPTAEAAVREALLTPMGLCSIILVDGIAAGYAQAIETGDLGPRVPARETALTFRVDAFVGDPGARARGVGQAALRLVADEVFATTLAVALIAIVPLRIEAAIRAHERVGFAWVRVLPDPLLGPAWLMRLSRPAM
jgi:RimJ/RimL family protein N-acetyltransferase